MYSNLSIVKILWRYKKQETLNEEELSELREWLGASSLHEALFDDLSNIKKWDEDIAERLRKDSNANWEKIRERVAEIDSETRPGLRSIGWWRYGAAVVVLGALLWGGWYMLKKDGPVQVAEGQSAKFKNDILPATGTAVLTLADGSVISLDSLKNGGLLQQGDVSLVKRDSAHLDYSGQAIKPLAGGYNTLTTPRGVQYQLTLPDGSLVWLNAGSSLHYPLAFSAHDRSVELRGEAYFEVRDDKERPFQVKQEGSLVRVLGTHFDIRDYPEDAISRTAVLEGSVFVRSGKDSVVVRPGQDAQLDRDGRIRLGAAHAEQAIAWKAGLFWFQQTPFEQILRELSRWYDIDIVYEGKAGPTFSGILPCHLPLTKLLGILEKGSNVLFTIDGKKVTVRF